MTLCWSMIYSVTLLCWKYTRAQYILIWSDEWLEHSFFSESYIVLSFLNLHVYFFPWLCMKIKQFSKNMDYLIGFCEKLSSWFSLRCSLCTADLINDGVALKDLVMMIIVFQCLFSTGNSMYIPCLLYWLKQLFIPLFSRVCSLQKTSIFLLILLPRATVLYWSFSWQ